MRWGAILGITAVLMLITWYEWPRINRNQKREKKAFVAFTIIGWLLAVLLVHYPEMTGPTQLVEFIYKPFGKLLPK